MFRRMLFASALAPLLLSATEGYAAAIVYTISGYGSFQEPGGTNTGGQWSFAFTGDTANGDYQSGLPGTLTLTPYSSAVPGYSGPLYLQTLLELFPATSPPYLFAFSLPSVTTYITLSGATLPATLGSAFAVTVPQGSVSIPASPIAVGDGTQYAYIQTVTTDVTFTGAAPAPELATWALMGPGLAGLAALGRRKPARSLRAVA